MKGDDRCPPDVNYLDWLINHLLPADMVNSNVDDIIEYERALRLKGAKPKKHVEKVDKEDIAALLRLDDQPKSKGPQNWRRI